VIAGAIRWERTRDNVTRYYSLFVTRDLFGACVLVRSWGRRCAGLGGKSQTVLDSEEECHAAIAEIEKRRAKHGYQRVSGPTKVATR